MKPVKKGKSKDAPFSKGELITMTLEIISVFVIKSY